MRDLVSAEPFSSIELSVRTAVSELMDSKLPVTIISEANLQGSLSVAPIEAALLESNIQYRRRLGSTMSDGMKNCIIIETSREGKGAEWNAERNILTVTETMSIALSRSPRRLQSRSFDNSLYLSLHCSTNLTFRI